MNASLSKNHRPAGEASLATARRVRACLTGLTPWRRRLAALAAGVASVLAMAPFFAFPVLFATLPVLLWLLDAPVPQPRADAKGRLARLSAHPAWHAALIGWWFAFGYFFAGLFWIGQAFLVEAEVFAVLLPVAVTLMPAGLALFWAGAAALARLPAASATARVVLLALALSGAEYLRGHVLTGFPWNVLGYALTWPLPLMQSAAYAGIYALTLLAVLVFAGPLVLWVDGDAHGSGARTRWLALALAAGPIALMALAGAWRLSAGAPADVAGVRVRVVQPSVPQREKWRPEHQERIFADHIRLSQTNAGGSEDGLAGISHVVWPEAAMPFLPLEYPAVRRMIGEMLPEGVQLIAGALRAEPNPPGALRPRRIFNSILVFGRGGELAAQYDKIHLVPFGEYLPFQPLLQAAGLEQLTRMRGGLDSGVRPRPLLRIGGLPPVTPLVCYEAIFPGAVVQTGERPGLLVNVTNDGWFGNTTGPRQHFHQARVRAVEEGVPLVRAANNGISAVFDAHGRVLGRLGLDVRGTIDTAVPAAIAPPPYARLGDGIFLCIWLGIAGALAAGLAPGLRMRRA